MKIETVYDLKQALAQCDDEKEVRVAYSVDDPVTDEPLDGEGVITEVKRSRNGRYITLHTQEI